MEEQKFTKNQMTLIELVERLALSYSANASKIPVKAYNFWFDATKGATLKQIRDTISDWSKTSTRMMSPSDLYKALQSRRALARETKHVEMIDEEKVAGMSEQVQAEWNAVLERVKSLKANPTDWAKALMIKEAYGFAMTAYIAESWRRALGYPSTYRFEDTEGVFPLDDAPDERCSLYHDCHVRFANEYEAKHGLNLVYDKELATKRYPTEPLRYDGRGMAVRSFV